jgi:acetolactate synthase I/II/III large subunit
MVNERNNARALVEGLQGAGVGAMFAYPGDPIIEFLEQARRAGLDVVLGGREATAAFMAEGLAMATGQVGLCVSTLGPGSTALLNGVAAANLDRVPVIAVSGQIETSRLTTFTHQIVDHEKLYAPVTKWASRLERDTTAHVLRKALRVAVSERPGAVHLSCSSDVFSAPSSGEAVGAMPIVLRGGGSGRWRTAGADPARTLRSARRPLLLAGIGALRNAAGPALLGLAESLSMPIVVSPMAKGVVPEDSGHFAGTLDMACNRVVWSLLEESDLIVAAGFDAVELIKPWSVTTPVMHIDTVENTDQIYPSTVEIVGDIGDVLTWLHDEVAGGPGRWSEGDLEKHRSRLRDAYYEGRVEGHLNPTDVIDLVGAAFGQDAVVTCDVGSHKLLVGQGWTAVHPRHVLMTNGLSSMGFGIPAAIAAQIGMPGKRVVAIIGDGGFSMTATELALAAARRLPLTCVVMVDRSLNRIELKQMALGYPSTATRLPETDVARLAESLGCHGIRVTTPAELEHALGETERPDRPVVIEAQIDPQQYANQF